MVYIKQFLLLCNNLQLKISFFVFFLAKISKAVDKFTHGTV